MEMRTRTILAFVFVAAALVLGCQSLPPSKPASEWTPQEARGAQVYQQNCAKCHYPNNTHSLHGPGLIDLDLNIAHDFKLGKSAKEQKILTVGLNSFNVLNHTNDMTYVGVITSPFFGHAVAAQPPRRMQLDVQFKF